MSQNNQPAPMSPAGPQSAVASPNRGRRPRGRVLIILGALLLLVGIAFTYTVMQRQAAMQRRGETVSEQGSGALPPSDLWRDNGSRRQEPVAPSTIQPSALGGNTTTSSAGDPEQQRLIAEAYAAPSAISGFGRRQETAPAAAPVYNPPPYQGGVAPQVPNYQVPPLVPNGGNDPNGQANKTAFLNREPIADPYLNAKREAPRSRWELKAGTVIPAIMIGGINSDLPGQIVGQVSMNVYDTISGNALLVPVGSKVVGQYDSEVVYGQNRVLVAWERIIFPDGSSISLGGMPGTDAAGYSGFNDRVNRHFWPTFRDALFMSVISGGAQISQQTNRGASQDSGVSASQIAAAALGQQFSQVGSQLVQRNLDRQPTLEIRPGYQFNVMLTKDVILPPWRR